MLIEPLPYTQIATYISKFIYAFISERPNWYLSSMECAAIYDKINQLKEKYQSLFSLNCNTFLSVMRKQI